MDISLIVCTRNRFDVLVKNLKHNLTEFSLTDEIIIVDSSSDDYSEKLKSELKMENIYYYRTKAGLPLQRNFGINHSSREIVLFLDDDVRLFKDSIRKLKSFFLTHPQIDGVTGALKEKYEPSKVKQYLEKLFSNVFYTSAFGNSGITRSGLPIIPLSDRPYHVASFLRGGFSAYKREILMEHFFDEHFNGYAYLEDTDFSLSVTKSGNFIFLPEFKGFHDHLSTLQKDHTKQRKQYIENFHYIFNKYDIGSKRLFYWTSFGLLIINFLKSLTSRNLSYVVGTWKGIIQILKKHKDKIE